MKLSKQAYLNIKLRHKFSRPRKLRGGDMKIENAKTREPNGVLSRHSDSSRVSIFSSSNRCEISYLRLDQLIPYHKQARKIFNQDEIDQLALTIKEHGIRQPLTVLRYDVNASNFEVISGERRLRAARQLGLKSVPCIIIDDVDKAEEIALIENIQRQDLHPIEIAKALKLLIDKKGWGGQTEIKSKIGMSNSQISELIKLTGLSYDVQDAILQENFRGRENFRKLFVLEDDEDKLRLIRGEKCSIGGSPLKTLSVLRVSFLNDVIKIQKNSLSKLSECQRKLIKESLLEIIEQMD